MGSSILTAFASTIDAVQHGDVRGYIAAILFLSGVGGIYSLYIQIQTRRWPSVRGELVRSGLRHGGAGTRVERQAVFDLEYTYQVDDVTYRGHRYSPWQVTASGVAKVLMERAMDGVRSAAGHHLPVYYNPRDPAKSYLQLPGVVGMVFTVSYSALMLAMPLLVFG